MHFTEIDGLPRNIITCITQDKYGYIWIGTGNGIARFDGKNFYTYDDLKSVGILSFLIDSKNDLWVGSDNGLYKYNRLSNLFELKAKGYIPKIQEDCGSIYYMQFGSIDKIDGSTNTCVYSDSNLADFRITQEGIWYGKSNGGVKLLSRESNFKKIESAYFPEKSVSIISKIDDKLFWGTSEGQLYVKMPDGKISRIPIPNHHYIKKIIKIDNEIWLATDGNGILVLDNNLHYLQILKKSRSQFSINSNSIYDIYQGANREIWVASYGAGITCILPDNQLFTNITPEKGNENSLISEEGTSVLLKPPYFYFGTNYGLSIWNEKTNLFKNLPTEKFNEELHGIKITAMCSDKENNIWVGTYDGLLGKYNSETGLIKAFRPCNSKSEQMQQIVLLHNAQNTNLLVGSQFFNRFLINFDMKKETSATFELDFKGSGKNFYLLNSIRENRKGEILALLSDKGLYHINIKDNILENRLTGINKQINGFFSDFYEDKQGVYWLSSNKDGLFAISGDGKVLRHFNTKDGFPTNTLIRLESIDDRFLWISTICGLSRFDMKTGNIINYNNRDGLPANEFLERISAKTDDGRIIFGSVAGFTIVNPTKVTTDTSKTEVVISDIISQNQSIHSHKGKLILTYPIEETKEIMLPYNMNSFTIHFFAKGKSFLQFNNYYYRLKGIEENWQFLGGLNRTNYTDLLPGTYIFEIKCSQKNFEDSKTSTTLIIHIRPPWYFSWYAFIIYIALLLSFVYLLIYIYTQRLRLRKEKEIADFKIQKEHELTEKKLAFFTNISHDLKTPLTLIDAPVCDLLQSKNLNKDQVNKLNVIRRNAKNLYRLISDLLDFRTIAEKQYFLEVKKTEITQILTHAYEAFKEECLNKGILFKLNVPGEITGFVDSKKMEKIVWNLLSNAIKFTNKGGTILLDAIEIIIDSKRYLKLVITDNGIGIAEEDKYKVFDRFFQVNKMKNLNQGGTGIGLSIVKELVEIHHGSITMESAFGKGSSFFITIPLEKDCYRDNEFFDSEDDSFQKETDDEYMERAEDYESKEKQKRYNQPIMLVVEDNRELNNYLSGHFAKYYKVFSAGDGLEGLSLAKDLIPDIILTDVLMPNMDGYQFCREIRNHFDTSHIPVVMLTANSAVEQQIEGITTGADAYITKPFDILLLDSVLKTTLENRKKMRDKFLKGDSGEYSKESLPQKDIEFISELKLYIEENMIDPHLDIDHLASYFSISRRQLNRKIKSLIDITPNNLIKTIRLRKAYKLIREEGMRVSEAAYQTGFSDPNYFTTCFKKEFGENPSQL